MKIEYGSVKYFELLGLRDKLKRSDWGKFGFKNLVKLQTEIDMKIKAIEQTKGI